jgi:hypothetical protein
MISYIQAKATKNRQALKVCGIVVKRFLDRSHNVFCPKKTGLREQMF